jgi:Cu/Ag efflux protein CusF
MKSIMRGALVVVALASLLSGHVRADERHTMTGVVLKVDPPNRTMVVSTDKVPGFMDAMAMPFSVPQAAMLNGLKPGTTIEVTYVVDKRVARREHSRARVREPGTEAAGAAPPEAAERPRAPESREGVLAVDQRCRISSSPTRACSAWASPRCRQRSSP